MCRWTTIVSPRRRFLPLLIPWTGSVKLSSSSTTGRSVKEWRGEYGPQAERVLRVVAEKVNERRRLLESLTGAPHLPEQIQRAKTVKELEPLADAWDTWRQTEMSLMETDRLLSDADPDIRALAREDAEELSAKLSGLLENTFPTLLVPRSATADYSAIVELKSGVGGDESSLFLSEMLRMYTRYTSIHDWPSELVSSSGLEGTRGGLREAMVEVKGTGSFDALRWEAGVHRVQRVPATEASGRVHTSTVQVLVFPSAPATGYQAQEEDIVNERDVKVEVMRSRGAGGQHVNTTESAVRLTHEPTGISVSMQDSRSQHQNRTKAWQILRARLLDRKLAQDAEKKRTARRSVIKAGDRSEKVRTYNFPQDRVTDHRIGLTVSNITGVMDGEGLQNIVEALSRSNEAAIMEDLLESTVQS